MHPHLHGRLAWTDDDQHAHRTPARPDRRRPGRSAACRGPIWSCRSRERPGRPRLPGQRSRVGGPGAGRPGPVHPRGARRAAAGPRAERPGRGGDAATRWPPRQGTEARVVQQAVQRLRDLCLVVGPDAAVKLAPAVDELTSPYPAGLGRPADELDPDVAMLVADAAGLRRTLLTAPPEARAVLDRLAAGPPVGHGDAVDACGSGTPRCAGWSSTSCWSRSRPTRSSCPARSASCCAGRPGRSGRCTRSHRRSTAGHQARRRLRRGRPGAGGGPAPGGAAAGAGRRARPRCCARSGWGCATCADWPATPAPANRSPRCCWRSPYAAGLLTYTEPRAQDDWSGCRPRRSTPGATAAWPAAGPCWPGPGC